MNSGHDDWSRKVFRLRGLPNTITTFDAVASRLSEGLRGYPTEKIHVFSLATTLNYWERPLSKISTVMLADVPPFLGDPHPDGQWTIPSRDNGDLILDTNFLGMTPLNEVDSSVHSADCIALSGLASHPFGSWQSRDDKTFMWIRDELPQHLPGIRVVVYGYRTKLQDSRSFQLLTDLAKAFINQLQAYGWCSPSAKPIAFLAHSLGGLVLKEAILQLANSPNDLYQVLLSRTRGAVFFGVPNLGMEQSYFRTIVQNNANEALIDDLARNSNYIRRLNDSFSGSSLNARLKCYWAFETTESHTTVILPDGSVNRNGPLAILVSRESATCRYIETDPSVTIPIDSNHSEMVKFARDSPYYHIVLSKLFQIYQPQDMFNDLVIPRPVENASIETPVGGLGTGTKQTRKKLSLTETLKILAPPELGARKGDIAEHYKNTFEWVFDQDTFKQWLQHGDGIFWIRGKPGSGKSTLMKFICQDRRVSTLLHDWTRDMIQIRADFFFHYRGTALQKSYEGLLRSILAQILTSRSDFYLLLESDSYYSTGSNHPEIDMLLPSSLEQSLRLVLTQSTVPLDLVLFFDALDGFDGHPDVISRFLETLTVKFTTSRTRFKTLFSSRLWDSFFKHFHACPGFDIQDFTQRDMESYCLGKLMANDLAIPQMIELVPHMVERSRGVFLWVELVIKDFCSMSSSIKDKTYAELEQQLESVPSELDEYYALIIRRLPHSVRWKTYALLEAIVRSNENTRTMAAFILAVVDCSDCATYQACQQRLRVFPRFGGRQLENYLREHCASSSGGLAEIINSGLGFEIQLMHQTVHEFVTSLRFKDLVLQQRANTIVENGHSFHLKFLVSLHGMDTFASLRSWERRTIGVCAKRAEMTSGNSLQRFLDSVPETVFQGLVLVYRGCYLTISSRLEFAVSFLLHLYVRDSISSNPSLIQQYRQPLLAHFGQHSAIDPDDCLMANLLINSGYDPRLDPGFISLIVPTLATIGASQAAVSLVLSILNAGHCSNPDSEMRRTLLQIGHPLVVEWLLEHGENPNSEDTSGLTPLDHAINPLLSKPPNHDAQGASDPSIFLQLRKCQLLIERGGKFRRTTKKTFKRTLSVMMEAGLDTTVLEQHFHDSHTSPPLSWPQPGEALPSAPMPANNAFAITSLFSQVTRPFSRKLGRNSRDYSN